MNARDVVLLVLHAFGDSMQGKTLLQKRSYFVALLCGWEKTMGFDAHYYGPYSAEIDNALGQLKALGFVDESRSRFGFAGDGGFEVSRYDYTLTSDGRRIASLRKRKDAVAWRAVREAVRKIKDAGDPNYVELSIAAKAYYLLDQKGAPATAEALIRLAEGFGWQITREQMVRSWEFLKELGLIHILGERD